MNWQNSNSGFARHAALKTAMALLFVFIAGTGAIYAATEGFRVVTSEDARRLSIAEHPRQIPDAAIRYESGASARLMQALHQDGRVAIVVFIYTGCNAVCSVMGTEFQQLQQAIRSRGLDDRIRLISISFDPGDTSARLAAYAERMHAEKANWRFVGVADASQRRALLDAFGIVVIPAPLGEFQHNAAFHIVYPDGRLARIVDYGEPEAALMFALAAADSHAKNRAPAS